MRPTSLILLLASVIPAFPQASVHYFEGQASLNGEPLTRNVGQPMPPGAYLRTGDGRLEISLGPDTYLRLGERTTVQLISASAQGTELSFAAGSAVVDSTHAMDDMPISVTVGGAVVRITTHGDYRFDTAPPELQIFRGEAVFNENAISAGKTVALPATGTSARDGFLDVWSANRRIRVNTIYATGVPPADIAGHEQPLAPTDAELATGPGSLVGLLPLAGILQPMPLPLRPYRVGAGFFGPASGFGLPSPQHVPFGPQVPGAIHGTGVPHFPTVIGH